MGFGIVRLKSQGSLVALDTLTEISLRLENIAKVHMHLSHIRLEEQGMFVEGLCLVQFALRIKDVAEV